MPVIDPRMVQWDSQAPAATIDPSMVKWAKPIPTMGESMQEELASRNPLEKWNAGIGLGLNRAAMGLKSMFTPLTPQDQQGLALGSQIGATGPGMAGNVAGTVATLYAPSSAISGAAGLLPAGGRLAADVAGQGALGAGYGALTSPGDRASGAVLGGAGGVLGSVAGNVVSGVLRPTAGGTAEAFSKEGIPLTVGQSAGGAVKGFEDALRAGSKTIGKRQGEALEAYSQNTINSVLPPGAAPVTGTGNQAIQQASQRYNQAYDAAFSKIGPVPPDATLISDMRSIVTNYGPKLIPSDKQALVENLRRIEGEYATAQGGVIDPRALKDLRRSFDALANTAFQAGNGRLGQAYNAGADAITGLVGRFSPQAAQELGAIDAQYAQWIRVQRAAGKMGADEGVFTPAQLKASIRELDSTKDKSAFARGTTMPHLRARAEQGIDVLGPTIPPMGPGTAEKMLPALWSQNLLTTLPYAAAGLLYQKPVQSMLTGQVPGQSLMSGAGPAFASAPIAPLLQMQNESRQRRAHR